MRSHPTIQLLTFASFLIVLNFAVDVLYAAWPNFAPVAGIKQAVTGA